MVWCPSRLHCSSLSHKVWQSCIMFSISVNVSFSLYLQLARKPWWRSRKHVHTWTKGCLLRDRMRSARIEISKQVCLPCYLFYTATFLVMTICSFHCDSLIIDCKTCLEIATKRTWSDAEANQGSWSTGTTMVCQYFVLNHATCLNYAGVLWICST